MRSIKYALAFAALVAPLGCAHNPTPTQATAAIVAAPRVASLEDDIAKAKAIVLQKFTDEGTTQVVVLDAEPTVDQFIYTFTCNYRRLEFGQMCLYQATGEVDIQSGLITEKHKLDSCLGVAKS